MPLIVGNCVNGRFTSVFVKKKRVVHKQIDEGF